MTRIWAQVTAGIMGIGLIAAFLSAQSASAAITVAGEFALPGATVGTNNQIAPGPDGNIWVTLDSGHDVAKVTPAGAVTTYDAGDITSAVGITAGPDGKMWVTQPGGVASFDPANPAGAVKVAVAAITDARGITKGPDGNLWTASADKVIKIPPAAPATFTSYPTTGVTGARAIAADATSLWVADFGGAQIVHVTTAGVGTPHATGGGPQGVAASTTMAAYSNPGTNPQTVGRITGAGNPLPTPAPTSDPFGATFGSDGAFWFAQFLSNNLGRLSTTGQYSTVASFSAGAGPRQITAGPGNTLWVTLDTADKIAKVTGVTPAATPTPTATVPPGKKLNTKLTKKPDHRVSLPDGKSKAKVTFRYQGVVGKSRLPGVTFRCRLKGKHSPAKRFAACPPPTTYRLEPGRYRFLVKAQAVGTTDTTPAKRKFRVRR